MGNTDNSKETLSSMHKLLAETLLAKIKDGTATAAELNIARQFLRDNGIDGVAAEGTPLALVRETLPFAVAGIEPEEASA